LSIERLAYMMWPRLVQGNASQAIVDLVKNLLKLLSYIVIKNISGVPTKNEFLNIDGDA
jgi:hypothetical protein